MSSDDEFDPLADATAQLDAQERAEKRKQFLRTQEVDDLRWLLADQRGRRIVWQLLEQAGLYRACFDINHALMAFREGERNHGLRLLAQIMDHCPETYPVMQEENRARPDERTAQ